MTALTWTGLRRRGSLDRSPGGRPRRWAGRLACTAAGVLAALGLAAPAAIAGPGGLVYAGCIGDHAGCTQTSPADALDYPSGLAVTPDGRQLYAAAKGGISHFTIDAAGNLVLAGYYPALAGYVNGLAVTPDGAHLYLASRDASSVSHFRIDPAGNLTFAGCIGATAGCTATSPPCALLGADALAVTPDGTHLYAGASSPSWGCPGSAVSHLRIDPAGNLIFAGCIGSLPGCTHVDAVAAQSVAMTPLGADVYSAGFSTVSHFRVDQYGNLIFAGCIGDYPGCTPITPGVLDYTVAVAVTNDGSQLYAAASSGSAIIHFTIAGFLPPPAPGPRTAPALRGRFASARRRSRAPARGADRIHRPAATRPKRADNLKEDAMRTRPITGWQHAAAAALASCLILAGCGAAQPPAAPPGPPGTLALPGLHPVSGPAARTYLGPVPGTSALIGIAVQGAHARGYLCDGIPGRAVTLADWFAGPVRDGTLDAVSGQHHARLAVRLGARTATGTITLPSGTAHPLTATLITLGTHAEMSEGDGELRGRPYHAGRIVLPGGEQPGAAAYPSGPIRGRAITYVPLSRI